MDTCDVVIVGGGPAGSACAWKLRQAGLDVVVIDAAVFPRDKVCAGWITAQILEELSIDAAAYGQHHTLQAITGFRTGLIGGDQAVETLYGRPVAYGIRRCEFDHYLLQRSAARLRLGAPIASIRREGDQWIVNDVVKAPALVGAGGHFCPVARFVNGRIGGTPVVAAQEVEFMIDRAEDARFTIDAETPELYFCGDMQGYGWCFRKQHHLNIGFGRLDPRALPKGTAGFLDFLKAKRKIPQDAGWRWRGHAYLVYQPGGRRVLDDGVLLVGDAAGLAYPQSGEGIRPAIESGLLAASTLIEAGGRYSRERLEPYQARLRGRFGASGLPSVLSDAVPARLKAALAASFLKVPWLVRHLVIDGWFLHTRQPALS